MTFADNVSQQQIFRHILAAMSYPGRVQTAPGQLADVVLTLVDHHVSLADPDDQLPPALWRWLGMAATATTEAQYIVSAGHLCPDYKPQIGTLESPEQGATIIIPVAHIEPLRQADDSKDSLYVSGPSRKSPKIRGMKITGLHSDWLAMRERWHEGFPRGTDWLFVAPAPSSAPNGGVALAAVPRSCELSSRHPSPDSERLDP